LHGAAGAARYGVDLLRSPSDALGLLVLAPTARGPTWDVILGGYGPDVDFLDRALEFVFGRWAVDPTRLAVGGFSDGASYALSLGLANGDLFTHILAFSPGFAAPACHRGRPRIYVSHGTHDRVLPIERCGRELVPMLRRAGYDVRYREFDGPHTVPAEIAREAAGWFTGVPQNAATPQR
jgi:phospholipase/carboxylesterase